MTDASATGPAEQLADLIAQQLRRSGEYSAYYHDTDELEQIRAAGRQAGRTLGRPVRTHAIETHVIVALTDWGQTNPLEAELTTKRANNQADRYLAQHPQR